MNSISVITLRQSLDALDRQTAARLEIYKERDKVLTEIDKEVTRLTNEVDLLDKTERTLQAVSSKVLGQSTSTIDQIVTAGLKAIFFDQKLEFKTTVDKYRGKTSIKFELLDNGRSAPLMDSYGGGVLGMIGVLLRITTILILNQRRVLFLDETLGNLSVIYHAPAMDFLKTLCEKQNFKIVLITHQDTMAIAADRHYEAKKLPDGSTTFELRK